jgi:hypothetical protein
LPTLIHKPKSWNNINSLVIYHSSQHCYSAVLNQQFDASKTKTKTGRVNIVVAPVMGAISAGVGVNIANVTTKNIATNFLVNQSASLGNSIIGAIQADYQFKSTVGFVDTQSEIDLTTCINLNGINSLNCKDLQSKVTNENTEAAKNNMILAIISDQVLDKTLTVGTFVSETAGKMATSNNNQASINNSTTTNRTPTDSV